MNINLYKNQNHAGCKSNTLVSEKVSNDGKHSRKCWQTKRIIEHSEVLGHAQINGSFKLQCN